ncbi:MAG: NUDIX domain-containing protein [Candidatus Cloacimonetes bacterium]|nr:NUDIX domain-containing protein [Candidatus Cloacimonadota bacterium]
MIRNSIKAIIIRDNKLLTIKCHDHLGTFYLLPGGGQNHGETMLEAVKRECLEEIGCEVKTGCLLFIREYLADNHEFAKFDAGVHQIEFMFECTINEQCIPKNGHNIDSYQVDVEWLELSKLMDYRLYPQKLRPYLMGNEFEGTIYLGDIN